MNIILSFVIEVALTFVIAALLVGYLRPFLRKVLIDLCGTEERAQFWMAFSNILLIGMPVIFALGYSPDTRIPEELFFEVARKLSGNFAGMLFAVIVVGCVISLFALFAPKQSTVESK
jgi:hypothetical protein